MSEILKTRGRKKNNKELVETTDKKIESKKIESKKIESKEIESKEIESKEIVDEDVTKKKRGRKKKWESTPFKNNYSSEGIEKVKFEEIEPVNENKYTTNALNFGNLCIKVHDREQDADLRLDNYFVENRECELMVSSDEEDTCNFKKDVNKTIKHYRDNLNIFVNKLKVTDKRCFNCHHSFDNPPFFLPFEYSSMLDKYKIFGNFCSPSCVKSYSLNNKTFENKSFLVGQYYRKLFGPDFRINCAPSIYDLIEYGGKMTIEEFRKTSYKNRRYTINNINTKIVYIT